MNTRTMAIVAGLILGCGILLAGAARRASGDGLKPAPTTPATSAGAVGELKVNIKEWDVPTKGAHPHDPAVAPDGSLWFTEQLQNKLGRLDPKSGDVKVYQMPDARAEDPHTAVFDARGILWFTVQVGNMVGRLDPQSGKIELKKVQGQRALPYGIAINSKGVPFFCEFGTNKMAKIDPQSM